jgi:hypothetical protein
MANSEAGALMKMFERIYPDLVNKMYEWLVNTNQFQIKDEFFTR